MQNLNKFTNSQNFGEIDIVNSRKKGSFLEWFIKRIFQTVGFYATNTAVINNNQIDVFVNYNDVKILVQCKQYEKSTPPVKDLIHEWNSKRMEIECDKALLVLWGYPKIEDNELKLAKKLKVYLWNDTLITHFFDLILFDVSKAKNEILLNLEIDNIEAQNVINSIKENIETRFKDFSLENKELVESLKEEVIDCYKDGMLIKQKKFEIIWDFLKNKRFYIYASIGAEAKREDFDNDISYTVIKRLIDFYIKNFDESKDDINHRYRMMHGIIVSGAIDKDGRTLIKPEDIFN